MHAVLDSKGATAPNSFIISADAFHGSSVAMIGEGTSTGPQALLYSVGAKGDNKTWDDRTLKIGLLAPGAGATANVVDATKSHYFVLTAARVLDDNADTSD